LRTLPCVQPAWGLLSWAELHDGDRYPRGDCGYGNRSLSLFLLGITLALLIIVWRRLPLSRRSFVFGVVFALTLLNIIDVALSLRSPACHCTAEGLVLRDLRVYLHRLSRQAAGDSRYGIRLRAIVFFCSAANSERQSDQAMKRRPKASSVADLMCR